MHLVCSTLPFRKVDLKDALQGLRRFGFNTVELCVDPIHSDPERWANNRDEILRLLHRLQMKVNSVHVPMKEGNLMPHDPAFRKDATEQSLKTIDAAVLLGADFIVQHVLLIADSSGSQQGYVLKNTVPDLEKVVQYAAAKRVQVAIENVPSSSFRMLGTSIQELMAFLQLFPPGTVGLCLDLNHCLACGFDPMEALSTLEIHRLISIHASDNLYAPLADRHLPIGKGDIPWEKIISRLNALTFQGSFVIEVLDEKALMDSINHLRSNDVPDLRKSLSPTLFNGDLGFPKRM